MNKYKIAARVGGTGFEVQVITTNGVRQTMLGFTTESEAQAWVVQDQRLTRAADPFRAQSGRLGKS